MKTLFSLFLFVLLFTSCKNETKDASAQEAATDTIENQQTTSALNIIPISHATMVLQWDKTVLYVDPVGGGEAFANQPPADIILITDIHGDHYNEETLLAVTGDATEIIAPKAVAYKIPAELQASVTIVDNDTTVQIQGITDFAITGIPMYNLREEALKFHTKGRGNGYVIAHNNERIYISGDTEDIPEMRNLQNIDIAFVCMNLPYTMTVDSAVSAVLDFAPTKVYPYHYRGTDGLSDVVSFKTQVNTANPAIEVVQLDWYAKRK